MKRLITLSLLITLISAFALNAQNNQKKDPVGQWKFEAPYAPEGFTTGVVEVKFAEKKYSATMTFTGSDYKMPGENVKFEKDTLSFSIYVEGETVNVTMMQEESLKMNGKAVYSQGSVPIAMTKVVKEEGK